MSKLVSVLIPTYHSDKTLLRAVDSVLAQSYPHFEVIVVDDNNPDDPYRASTESLMERYAGNKHVKYIKHEHNKNGSAARNTAFRNSAGDYISLLDDDDFYYEDKLRVQVEYMEKHPDVMGTYCWRKQNGKEICGTFHGDLSTQILSLEFTPTTDALMFRREAFEELSGFDESYRRHQDFEFLLRYFEKYTLDYVSSIQVEISSNGVNNIPKGKKLVEVKEQFFRQFAPQIERIWNENETLGRQIYRNHFVDVYKDLIRDHEFKLANYVYKTYGKKCSPGFWKLFIYKCLKGRLGWLQMKLHAD